MSCTLRRNCDFCNLPQPLLSEFNAMGHLTLYPANATLLTEGANPARHLHRLLGPLQAFGRGSRWQDHHSENCGGPPGAGAERGSLRGACPITVTTIELCQIKFIERDSFLRLIERTVTPRSPAPPCLPRDHDFVRRCARPAARPQLDGETRPPAAFLGLG
jgi:hypothetical protein